MYPPLSFLWQVCVLGLHLAKELCEIDEDGDYWLQVTRKVPVLPTTFTALEISLRVKQNLHFTEASLHLLFTLARTQQVRNANRRELVALLLGLYFKLSCSHSIVCWHYQPNKALIQLCQRGGITGASSVFPFLSNGLSRIEE